MKNSIQDFSISNKITKTYKKESIIDNNPPKIIIKPVKSNVLCNNIFIQEIQKIIENEIDSNQKTKQYAENTSFNFKEGIENKIKNTIFQNFKNNIEKENPTLLKNDNADEHFLNINLGNRQKIIKINSKIKRKKKRKILRSKLETIPEERSNADLQESALMNRNNHHAVNLMKKFRSNKKAERIEINLQNYQNINVFNIYNGSSHLVKRSFNETDFFPAEKCYPFNEQKLNFNERKMPIFKNFTNQTNIKQKQFSKIFNNFAFKNKNLFRSQRSGESSQLISRCIPLDHKNIKFVHSQDVIWNSFLNSSDTNQDFKMQLENILHKLIIRFSTKNQINYSANNIFLLFKLQVQLDNKKFHLLNSKTKIKVLGMIFSKFVDRFELSNLLQNFLPDVDFRKSKSPSVSIYR